MIPHISELWINIDRKDPFYKYYGHQYPQDADTDGAAFSPVHPDPARK